MKDIDDNWTLIKGDTVKTSQKMNEKAIDSFLNLTEANYLFALLWHVSLYLIQKLRKTEGSYNFSFSTIQLEVQSLSSVSLYFFPLVIQKCK